MKKTTLFTVIFLVAILGAMSVFPMGVDAETYAPIYLDVDYSGHCDMEGNEEAFEEEEARILQKFSRNEEIKKLYKEGKTIEQIMRVVHLTYDEVYFIVES